MAKQKTQKQNIGNAGEYYIASRLSALNFVATITLGRAEKYDILTLSPKGKLSKISIKTKEVENTNGFILSIKDETGQSDDFYYIFVKLNEFEREPDFWVIPSNIVCPLLREGHDKWRNTLGKNNKKHGVSNVRYLPIRLKGSDKLYYPQNWETKMEKYYKNLEQLL
ncbi:MAG: hypothetical protein UR85_C0002G0036 [Candidatus Nomurabacteria bacterium GW2011_GWF2_35_66]|uniref:PD(D/E)XK endonuclease domain-containing protein n=1 Tax=Candidatus Nomurabacteria bacterium GW2011_GWE1_35_16 TaxID=1618761 RepID=A0A0G0BAW4_9BACT|nr:MAG: hypothetical protein UR55_C0007G0006 [Candidatus Nomurabacteria bacterium GW2011_GWF1_34_20]KKP63281.1 MAG: hypothetical protein UR57_C0006G0006 [Candidatus Nomurabacteria bacterium GW2011_GWE2_34_25]KKP66479.1 MAG: hypothetical protein UR64_C0006G0006 [Candidatus Nomurabacteria bacterium GW2011_GWE1_35_16]KKP83723.1 MAG: hypothetical protein UR85_C0002G0036 [Candidatus Nomurabacteria bacterium GW2011_GWF2_35_66]HAE36413.1 hypothetical protein [Candidatus Nomurabacteria bacterium]